MKYGAMIITDPDSLVFVSTMSDLDYGFLGVFSGYHRGCFWYSWLQSELGILALGAAFSNHLFTLLCRLMFD